MIWIDLPSNVDIKSMQSILIMIWINLPSDVDVESVQSILIDFEDRDFWEISDGVWQVFDRVLTQVQVSQVRLLRKSETIQESISKKNCVRKLRTIVRCIRSQRHFQSHLTFINTTYD